jgi:hypothetical protein
VVSRIGFELEDTCFNTTFKKIHRKQQIWGAYTLPLLGEENNKDILREACGGNVNDDIKKKTVFPRAHKEKITGKWFDQCSSQEQASSWGRWGTSDDWALETPVKRASKPNKITVASWLPPVRSVFGKAGTNIL